MEPESKPHQTSIYYIASFLLFLILTGGVFLLIRKISGGAIDIGGLFYIRSFALGLLLILTFVLYILADSWRLYYLLCALGYRLPFFYIVKLTLISIFVANITPMAAGGGFIQLYLLHKKGVPIATATAVTGLRTFLAILIFIIIFPLAVLLLPGSREFLLSAENRYYFAPVVIAYILFLLLLAEAFWHQKAFIRIVCAVAAKALQKLRVSRSKEKLLRLEGALTKLFYDLDGFLFKNWQAFIVSLLITSLYLALFILIPLVLMYNYVAAVPFFDAFVNQVIVVFLTYFGLTPGSAGIAELVFVFFNSAFISGPALVSLTFMWRFVSIYLGMILGGAILIGGFVKRRIAKINKTGSGLS